MKTMVVPERLFIHTDKVKELMDNMAKITVVAFEVWKREKAKKNDYDLSAFSPESLCEMFIQDISK